MERRSFVAGLATSGVAGLVRGRTAVASGTDPSALDTGIAAAPLQAADAAVRTAAAARPLEENALAREIIARALGPRFPELPRAQYESLHRSLEPALRRALPPGRAFSQFSTRTIAGVPADDPLRAELRQLTEDASLQRVLAAAGVRQSGAPTPSPNTCLVLSGGGAKGSFEVGFLAYLKKFWGALNITAVCGTSVGAVNAVPIAQSGPAGIDRLVDLWLALRSDADMYEVHPSLLPAKVALQALGMDIDDLGDLLDKDGLDKLTKVFAINLDDEVAAGAVGVGAMVGGAALAGPWGLLFGLGGLIATGVSAASASNSTGQVLAKFKLLGQALAVILSAPGLNSFRPLEALIMRNLDVSQIGQPGRPRLRLAMVCLEDGDMYYFSETGGLLRGSANASKATESFWNGPITADKVRQAVIASSSPPLLFPAVPLREDHGPTSRRRTRAFIDGGVRELLPARAAVDLGCERVIGVLASPLQMAADEYPASPPPFFPTALRAMETMLNEVARTDTEHVKDPTLRVLTHPMTDVIDSFTVDPGLIRINVDYGYMRGFDATLGIAGKQLNLSEQLLLFLAEEEIVRLRKEIWRLEQVAALLLPRGIPRPGSPPNMVPVFNRGMLASIREKKREIFDWTLIRFQASRGDRDSLPIAIDGAAGPATCIHDWWRTWEKHRRNQLSDAVAANDLWTRLRIGLTGPGNTIDVLEPPGSVPAAPATTEFAC
jgi:NTE family protein